MLAGAVGRAVDVLPAYAGMIHLLSGNIGGALSAPRVCGDDPARVMWGQEATFVLPAYAGMIRQVYPVGVNVFGAPRVCGDDPRFIDVGFEFVACSPRMRG
mgnify:CR=1 FL=1